MARTSLNDQLAALVTGRTPSSVHTRSDGSTYTTWAGFSAGVSRGSGEETHTVTIHLDTLQSGVYAASYACRRSASAGRTSDITTNAPTCKRCAKSWQAA